MPLSLSLHLKALISSLKTLSSKLSQCHSLKLTHSPPLAWLILNVAVTETQRHQPTNCLKPPISLRPMPPIVSDPLLFHQSTSGQSGWCFSSLTSTLPLGCSCAPASWIEVAFHGLECLLVDQSGYRYGCACSWILCTWLGNPWSSPTHSFCRPSSPTLCLFVIGDFVWFGLRKKIGDLGFFFFFAVNWWWWWLWLRLMVEVVVVGAVDVFWVVGDIILL